MYKTISTIAVLKDAMIISTSRSASAKSVCININGRYSLIKPTAFGEVYEPTTLCNDFKEGPRENTYSPT